MDGLVLGHCFFSWCKGVEVCTGLLPVAFVGRGGGRITVSSQGSPGFALSILTLGYLLNLSKPYIFICKMEKITVSSQQDSVLIK